MSEEPLFSFRNRWFGVSVATTAGLAVAATIAGLLILPLAQPNLKLTGLWDAICSAAGILYVPAQTDVVKPEKKTSSVVVTSGMLTNPDQVSIGRGATLAQKCAICHGPQGVSDANSPDLAGQFAAMTYKELNDFKAGVRVNTIMSPFSVNMTDRDMRDLAAYYSYLPRVPSNQLDERKAVPAIVVTGAPLRNIPPCGSCHEVHGSAGSPRSISRRSSKRSLRALAVTTSASRCAMSRGG
jgi:cytochrome c553